LPFTAEFAFTMEVMLTGQKNDSIAKITMWSEQKQLKKVK